MKSLQLLARWVAGAAFVFAGFVKSVDPSGSAYKFTDYFMVMGLDFLSPAAMSLAIGQNIIELLIGLWLITGLRMKQAAWGLLLFMVFYTPLTLWIALRNPVTDCGCFGDALVITNWETFWKNLVLLALAVFIFVRRGKFPLYQSPYIEYTLSAAMVAMILGFNLYNLRNLPILDFRPYSTGTSIPEGMMIPEGMPLDEFEQFFTLKDTATGREVEIPSKEYLADSNYWRAGTSWQYVSASEPKLVKKGYEPPIHDFVFTTLEGVDVTQEMLTDTGEVILFIAHNLAKAPHPALMKTFELSEAALNNGYKVFIATASGSETIRETTRYFPFRAPIVQADDIMLKTIIRSNPGLVILKKGVVLGKWHYNNFPGTGAFREQNIEALILQSYRRQFEHMALAITGLGFLTISLLFMLILRKPLK